MNERQASTLSRGKQECFFFLLFSLCVGCRAAELKKVVKGRQCIAADKQASEKEDEGEKRVTVGRKRLRAIPERTTIDKTEEEEQEGKKERQQDNPKDDRPTTTAKDARERKRERGGLGPSPARGWWLAPFAGLTWVNYAGGAWERRLSYGTVWFLQCCVTFCVCHKCGSWTHSGPL